MLLLKKYLKLFHKTCSGRNTKNQFQLYLSKVSEHPKTVWKSCKNTLSNDICGALLLLKVEHKREKKKAQQL